MFSVFHVIEAQKKNSGMTTTKTVTTTTTEETTTVPAPTTTMRQGLSISKACLNVFFVTKSQFKSFGVPNIWSSLRM